MSETKLQVTVVEPRCEAPTKAAAPDWRFVLTMGLSMGIGIPVARQVTPAIWPGLDFPGSVLVSAAMVGLAAGIVALVVGKLLRVGSKR